MGWEEFEAWRPVKKAAKDVTSTYPFFSDVLDQYFDLKTAKSQYAFYASFLGSAAFFAAGVRKRHMFSKIKVTSIVSKFYKDNNTDITNASLFWTSLLFPVCTCLGFGVVYSKRRNEEIDKSGARFRRYMRDAVYSGLDEQTGAMLARDIVIRSDSFSEGLKLLEIALNKKDAVTALTKDVIDKN